MQSANIVDHLRHLGIIKGGRQRWRFQASSSSSATARSTQCHSRWPVSDAIVEFR
jgi:hypothetical protein